MKWDENDEKYCVEFDTANVLELLRCKSDPAYFIFNYVKIFNLDEGVVLIKKTKVALRILARIHKNQRINIRSSRQVGTTTINLAYILWKSIFNRDLTIMVGGYNISHGQTLLSMIKDMHNRLPEYMKRTVTTNNSKKLTLDNGTSIRIFPTNNASHYLRGYSINYLYTEFLPTSNNIDDFFNHILPVMYSLRSSKIILVNVESKVCRKLSQFTVCRIPWHFNPKFDHDYKRNMISLLGYARWHSEFEAS